MNKILPSYSWQYILCLYVIDWEPVEADTRVELMCCQDCVCVCVKILAVEVLTY